MPVSSSENECSHILSELLEVKRGSEDKREVGCCCLLGFSFISRGCLWNGRDREDAGVRILLSHCRFRFHQLPTHLHIPHALGDDGGQGHKQFQQQPLGILRLKA